MKELVSSYKLVSCCEKNLNNRKELKQMNDFRDVD